MAKAIFILPDGSTFEGETTTVPSGLESKVFTQSRLETREIVLSTRPQNPAERKLLNAMAFYMYCKGEPGGLMPHLVGSSIVSASVAA